MKRLLNTLYVTAEDAWLRKDGANVVVEIEGTEKMRVPVHLLGSIACFSRPGLSPALLGFCAAEGVGVSLHTPTGRFLARVEGPQTGNVLLRRAQHAHTFDEQSALPTARAIIAAKATNQRAVLSRALRDGAHEGDAAPLDDATRRLKDAARLALTAANLDEARGREGEGANAYFGVFDALIRRPEPELTFKGRSRRPPLDASNAVLSFLYALLAQECRSALEGVGLDPQMGFLHRDRPGRPSLALDLMEEFRAPMADRTCLTLFNRRQLGPSDFRAEPNGAVLLSEDARKTVLVAWQERKKTELTHAFLGEKIPLGLCPHVQAQLMARWLRGDLDGYPPFIWS